LRINKLYFVIEKVCIFLPILIIGLNPFIEYHWVLDNLLGLQNFFYIYFFFLFFLFIFKKKNTNVLLTVCSCFLFYFFSGVDSHSDYKLNKNKKYQTFSTFQYNMFFNQHSIKNIESIVKKKEPDFLIFQELTIDMGVALYNKYKDVYKYSIGRKPKEGFPSNQLFMSKYEILEGKIEEFENKKYRVIEANINLNGENVFFYVMHPPSPKTKKDWENRNFLLNEANLTLLTQKNPFLLIGDLNITPNSNQFKHIFEEGFYNFNLLKKGNTWHAFDIPFVSEYLLINEIDLSLSSKNIYLVEKNNFENIKTSDHYPVFSRFKLLKQE
jgi:exonuclease III